MQNLHLETGYKIPKIDCIKLRCKNSASGKLNTKYLKLAASSYSLSQNCSDTVVSSRPSNVGVHNLATESNLAKWSSAEFLCIQILYFSKLKCRISALSICCWFFNEFNGNMALQLDVKWKRFFSHRWQGIRNSENLSNLVVNKHFSSDKWQGYFPKLGKHLELPVVVSFFLG